MHASSPELRYRKEKFLGSFLEQDKSDIQDTLAGSSQAFGRLVERYQRYLYFFCLRILKNPEDADEIVQKAFVKAYRALAGFEFKASFKTWLTTIALNLCRTELGKKKRQFAELDTNVSDGQYEQQQENEDDASDKGQLRQALEGLPPRQREIVLLRIYQELPFKEIALALKSTETAVKVNFHHAMKSLRKRLQSESKDEKD